MEVKEILCYNKDLDKFMSFNEHCIDDRFIKSTGYRPVNEPKEEPLLDPNYQAMDAETVIPALGNPCSKDSCESTGKCDKGKECKKGKRKKKIDGN